MGSVAEFGEDHDAARLARLLDPVSLEARLADARVRREARLAARAAAAAGPDSDEAEFDEAGYPRNLPGMAMRGAGVILTGLAGLYALVVASCLILTPNESAPEMFLLAAAPSPPAALPSAPRPAVAGWLEPPSALPVLVALAPAAAASPHPVRLAGPVPRPAAFATASLTAPATVASRTRVAGARVAGPRDLGAAASVMGRAVASTLVSMVSRSGPLLPHILQSDGSVATRKATSPAASPKRGGARQSARNGGPPVADAMPDVVRKVVRDVSHDLKRARARAEASSVSRKATGPDLSRAFRDASSGLQKEARSAGWSRASEKSPGKQANRRDTRGPDKASPGGRNTSKGKAAGPRGDNHGKASPRGGGHKSGKASGRGGGKSNGKGGGKGRDGGKGRR